MLKESKLKPVKSELAEMFLEEEELESPVIKQLQRNLEIRDTPIVKQLKDGLRIK